MKLLGIARFELAYQLRRGLIWLVIAVLIVFAFLMTRDAALAEALREEFFLNSPFSIAKVTVISCLLWLLVGAAIAGEAAARDVTTRMHPLTYTTPVTKADYLGGRFLAAFALNALILLAAQAGILLAVYAPGVQAELIGPVRLAGYLTAYAFIALPNAFVATAIQFSFAARSGRPAASYLGSVLLFCMAYVVSLVAMQLGQPDVARLTDPIGVMMVLTDLSLGWTPIERSTRLLELTGPLLWNRLLWVGIGLGALAVTHLRFRFAHRAESTSWRRRAHRGDAPSAMPVDTEIAASKPISIARGRRALGSGIHARQTLAIAWDSFRSVAKSWPGLAMLAAIPTLAVLVVVDQMTLNGVPLVPITARVINQLTAPLAQLSRWVVIPLLMVFFAGELVWREREAGLGDITDATPVSEWVPLLGKFLGLGLLLVVLMALLVMAGMVAQVVQGYHVFEVGLYLKVLFGLQLPEYLLFTVLALVVHVLVNQKYVAHLVAIIAYVFISIASLFGVEHKLLIYGASPAWTYTEMRGFGPTLGPWVWFHLYWAAWAMLLAVAARVLCVRGRESGLGARWRLARPRLTRATIWAAAAAAGLMLTCGGFIFYNTNVLNEYMTAADITGRQAEYERLYGRYKGVPQPRLTGTSLTIDIYPNRREVEIRGTYRLVNRSSVAVDSIHLATVPGVETGAVSFDRSATIVVADEEHGHRIYALESPLQPGDSLGLDFEVHIGPHGFRNRGVDDAVAPNGTWFTNEDWLPAIGYQPNRELTSAGERRAHGLAPRPLIASLYDVDARMSSAGRISFQAVVGTDEDQVAVAPGTLRRIWTEGGRRYFQYWTDAPIGNQYAVFSAHYALEEARWHPGAGPGQDVAIRIFHHPGHTGNLDRMVRSARASLEYYSAQFGPYPYGHLTFVEYPGGGTGMHAEASMITYEEGFATWNPKSDPGSFDLPYAVVAHEMAHQWTVPYALAEGAPFLSEGLAWYGAMGVVKRTSGRDGLGRLLSFMRQPYPYPPIHHGEPLLRALDPYLAYRKGPFALLTLREYLGEELVNGAIRRMIEAHRSGEAPLATTLDLYGELQGVTPDSLRYLLHDLFEVNAFWAFAAKAATAEQTAAGVWEVTLDVRASKVVVDSAGGESPVPMDEWVQIGVFAPVEDGGELSDPLYVRMHRIRAGEQTITVTVPRKPALAGIDPYHLLDWLADGGDDNIKSVEGGS